MAHTFGLDHPSGDGRSQNSCMDYFSNKGVNPTNPLSTKSNARDCDELNRIYGHLDTKTTFAATVGASAGMRDNIDDSSSWDRLLSQSANGRNSTYERFNSDSSRTIAHVYWTEEAAVDCPSCDHRYDHDHGR